MRIDPAASEGQGLRVSCHTAGADSVTHTLQTDLTDRAAVRRSRLMRVMGECRLWLGHR